MVLFLILFIGHVMVITAVPYGNPNGNFIIKFNDRHHVLKESLHFNPRFNIKVVVRNTRLMDGEYVPKEERKGDFPFVIDQQFKLAIGFTETAFKFAVNGKFFAQFNYREQNVLPNLNGLKLVCGNGMEIEISSVDHLNMGVDDCEGFESYSDPDVQLL